MCLECHCASERTPGGGRRTCCIGSIARSCRVAPAVHCICDHFGHCGDFVEGVVAVVRGLANGFVATVAVRSTFAYVLLVYTLLLVLFDLGSTTGSAPERHSSRWMGGGKTCGFERGQGQLQDLKA